MAASVLLTVAALTACSGPTTPAPTTTPAQASAPASATPAPTASVPSPTWPPQVALPTPPPEMARDDETGAIAAATYFLTELYPYTVTSQDTTGWLAMSHDLCVYCASVADSVNSEASRGERTKPGAIKVTRQTVEEANPLSFGVKLDILTGADTHWSRGDQAGDSLPPHRVSLGIVIVWQVDRWIVRGVDVFSSEAVA